MSEKYILLEFMDLFANMDLTVFYMMKFGAAQADVPTICAEALTDDNRKAVHTT